MLLLLFNPHGTPPDPPLVTAGPPALLRVRAEEPVAVLRARADEPVALLRARKG